MSHHLPFSSLQIRSDSDRGESSIKYILSGEGAGEVFQIDEHSGEIRTLKSLDREEKAFYVLQAQAINRWTNEPEEPQSEFIIKVQDINDNPPQFQNEPYVSSIPEMSPTGEFLQGMIVLKLRAVALGIKFRFDLGGYVCPNPQQKQR